MSKKINLPDWLSDKRLIENDERELNFDKFGFKNIKDRKRTPFQRDIDIITFDSAFRRLAHKTQVSLNPAKDFSRTRLTHSIEVSRIGRQAARVFADLIWGACDCKFEYEKRCFEDAVGAACLVHDIGHPAFGHVGEKYLDHLLKKANEKYGYTLRFEGNKQNFRLLAGDTYKARSGENGMNLTFAVLDGICKYKRETEGAKAGGVYSEDQEKLNTIISLTKCRDISNPITYIVELADDISYCASDIEDSLKQGWLPKDQVAKALCDARFEGYSGNWNKIPYTQWQEKIDECEEKDCYESLKTAIIKGLLIHVFDIFDQLDFSKIEPSDVPSYLRKEWKCKPVLEMKSNFFSSTGKEDIKKAVFTNGFLQHPVLKQSESQAIVAIDRIWEHFFSLGTNFPKSLEGLVPKDFNDFFKDKKNSHESKMRAVVDFISGMTDRYALHFVDVLDGRSGSLRI